ncbi:MAG TPA: cytochrome c [Sulfuricaulis sp.]|nr:cytochrome c [Sulfuricaulis sp.]
MKHSMLSTAIAVIALSLLLIPTLGYAQDVIEKRQKLMESNDDANKAIRAAAKVKDYATLEVKAKVIMDNMGTVLDFFPKGSISETSEAHPDIWDKWDEFSKHPGKVKAVAEALRKAAAAKDDAQINAQVKAMGGLGSGACGGCHVSFNKKRMKKG